MLKRTLLISMICFIVSGVFAQNVREFTLRANIIDGHRGLTVTGYFGKEKSVIIPAMIDNLPVTSIGDQAFMLRDITHVVIPEGMLIIGKQAFYGNRLTRIYLPVSVRSIGEAAFDGNALISFEQAGTVLNRTVTIDTPPLIHRTETIVNDYVIAPPPEVNGMITVIEKQPSGQELRYRVQPSPPPPPIAQIIVPGRQLLPSTRTIYIEQPVLPATKTIYVEKTAPVITETIYVDNPPQAPKTNKPVYTAPQPSKTKEEENAPTVFIERIAPNSAIITQMENPKDTILVERSELQSPVVQKYREGERTVPINREHFIRDLGPVSASKAKGKNWDISIPNDEGNYYLKDNGNRTATLVSYQGAGGSFASIPAELRGLKTTIIGHNAFNLQKLSKISIPPSVVYIGDGAFAGNTILDITIPESVRYIGFQAFTGNDIKKITVGTSVNIQPDSFHNRFSEYYNSNGQQGGTYIWHDGSWSFTNLNDVRYYYQ